MEDQRVNNIAEIVYGMKCIGRDMFIDLAVKAGAPNHIIGQILIGALFEDNSRWILSLPVYPQFTSPNSPSELTIMDVRREPVLIREVSLPSDVHNVETSWRIGDQADTEPCTDPACSAPTVWQTCDADRADEGL